MVRANLVFATVENNIVFPRHADLAFIVRLLKTNHDYSPLGIQTTWVAASQVRQRASRAAKTRSSHF